MDKRHAHDLLDQLDAGQFEAVGHALEVMVDPVARAVAAAPPDDEPVTEEDRRRFHEGREDRKREFFLKMKANLANDDPRQQDQMVDEFRRLILGG